MSELQAIEAITIPLVNDEPVVLYRTPVPSIWLVDSKSRPGRRHRMTNVGTVHPTCHCEHRNTIENPCRHLKGLALHLTGAAAMSNEPGTAVAVAEPAKAVATRQPGSVAVINQNNATAAMRSLVEGYKFALQFADMYLTAGQLPKKFATPGEMATALLKGAELNLNPMQTLEWVFVVNGLPQLEAKGLLGIIEHSGKGHVHILESDDKHAKVKGVRPGHPDMVVNWTLQEATKAGSKETGGWTDKLIWKAVARVARRMFPDVIGGMAVYDGGDILDTETLELQPGEAGYQAPTAEPPAAPQAKKVWAWGADMTAALAASPDPRRASPIVRAYLAACVPNYEGGKGDEYSEAIDFWLYAAEVEPAALVSAAFTWADNGRPRLDPIVAPAWDPPAEPADDEPEPVAATVEGEVITAEEAQTEGAQSAATLTMALDDLPFE